MCDDGHIKATFMFDTKKVTELKILSQNVKKILRVFPFKKMFAQKAYVN